MKAIVHIGQPKAGSSSIQEFLKVNKANLAAQGHRYDNARRAVPHGSQLEYALCACNAAGELLKAQDQRVRYQARTLEEQAEYDKVFRPHLAEFAQRFNEPTALFSSEHFYPWLNTPAKVQALDSMFSEAFEQVDYLLYLRHPVDQVASAYSERVKRGKALDLDTFISRRRNSLNLHGPVKRWLDVVGPERLHVRLFERESLVEGDLLADYCDFCGIDLETCDRPDIANTSLSAPAIEALRALNKMFPEIKPEGGYNPLRKDLLEQVTSLSKEDIRFHLTEEQGERVMEFIAGPNEKVRKALFPEREKLFLADPKLVPSHDLAAIRERALEILAEIVTRLRLGEIPGLSKTEQQASYKF